MRRFPKMLAAIEAAMKEQGVTQRELGELVGRSQPNISQFLRGARGTAGEQRLEMLLEILSRLGLSFDEFLAPSERKTKRKWRSGDPDRRVGPSDRRRHHRVRKRKGKRVS